MIENESQLRYAIECMSKMYQLAEREANEPLWDSETRTEVAEDSHQTRLKIEREVAEFLAKKYDLLSQSKEGQNQAQSVETEKAA